MNQAYLFNQGKNYQSYKMLGARPDVSAENEAGYRFAVWAPHAKAVSVVGDFNGWDASHHPLEAYGTTGIWQTFVPGAKEYQCYKYAIQTADGRVILKADPFARHSETRPNTASKLYDYEDDYQWQDEEFIKTRCPVGEAEPLNIYEVHLGSWRRYADGNTYSYRDMALQLAKYVKNMGYNAVEFMPIMEHPLDASWGYQVSGYYAVSSRYGIPSDFKYLVDVLHQHNIKVILDWVPGHFPRDAFALARFDGSALYEYPDPQIGEHPDWGTLVFNFGLAEVRSFLISNAWFWIDEFHIDGLRVDAVSSMIYLNFGRKLHESARNKHGGYENLEAIEFLRELNQVIRNNFPYCIMAAEESTAFPYVTSKCNQSGLGFSHKWNMGWMNDTLEYMSTDYYARGHLHENITFSMVYAFSEHYILPFSHDEVVHGKKSLLNRMPGDYWRKFASLRTCYMYQMSLPGAKLNFMGNEFAPFIEWRYYEELEWFLLDYPSHKSMQNFVADLNATYLQYPALWQVDDSWAGFDWLVVDDKEKSIFSYARHAKDKSQSLVVLLNMTPASYETYRLPVPFPGKYKVILNSDEEKYYGSSFANDKLQEVFHTSEVKAAKKLTQSGSLFSENGQAEQEELKYYIDLALPPLSGLFLLYEGEEK